MKNHYQLLGLDLTAPSDEIKRAFRREIARYHPDKVQHLGPEFQEIAATRAAELTEAYRVLMDPESRRKYDDAVGSGVGFEPAPAPPAPPPSPAPSSAKPPEPPPAPPKRTEHEAPAHDGLDRRFEHQRATKNDFVRKAAIAKLRDAVGDVAGSVASVVVDGFDAAYVIKSKRSMFKKVDPEVRLLARFVPHVDGAAIAAAWPLATKAGAFNGIVCLLLLGSGVSSAKELGVAVAEQRRKTRGGAPIVVPVDVRDWEALFPPEAPEIVRRVVQRLQTST